jgi:hypothetical protein
MVDVNARCSAGLTAIRASDDSPPDLGRGAGAGTAPHWPRLGADEFRLRPDDVRRAGQNARSDRLRFAIDMGMMAKQQMW